MNKHYVLISGRFAEGRELDDLGEAVIRYTSGPHAGHEAEVRTAKHNCGAYEIDVFCECGAEYKNDVFGCWQWGHQRTGSGDPTLEVW